jgi:lactate dehydrogenase-like 2-hydroxyacid dehydrogenase
VFADEPTDAGKWAGVPNLTLHPHNGGGVLEAIQQSQALVVENLRRHFAGETLINALN